MTMGNDDKAALRRLSAVPDEELDLAEAALLLAARERPGVALNRYRSHLYELAADTATAWREQNAGGAAAKLKALRTAIARKHGYAGDRAAYDDLQNANLMRVVDRRKGLPIALGILYLHAGRALGWDIAGLNFPGHFLLRLDDGGVRLVFDPFDAAAEIDASDMRALLKAARGADAELTPDDYAVAGNRDILIRLQNNRKIRLLKTRQVEDALAVVEDMLLFAPNTDSLWHEAGMLHSHLGNLRAALVALEQCRALAGEPEDRFRAERLIAELRTRLN